jgi:hypothetical protein
MAKHLPATVRANTPTTRVTHYVDPAPARAVVLLTPAQLAAQRREQHLLYARWAARQNAIAEHDRKVRRFWLGFGAIVAVAVLAGLAVLGWLAYRAVTGAGIGLLAVPAVVLAVAGLVVGGHRCITVVQHWH